jgi:acyl carrier protein
MNNNDQLMEILKHFTRDNTVWNNASDETEILKGLKINSSRFVDIIMKIEDEFAIEINDNMLDSILTIGDARRVVNELAQPR